MSSRPSVTGKQAVKALERLGFRVLKSTGSSHQMVGVRGTSTRVPVPVHSAHDLPLGTLKQILRALNVTEKAFYEAL